MAVVEARLTAGDPRYVQEVAACRAVVDDLAWAARARVLARLAPGAVYPSHRHRGVEEIYLIEGDLLINGVLMRGGDYCSAAADSLHDGIRSPSGCVFVVTASSADEFLAGASPGPSRRRRSA